MYSNDFNLLRHPLDAGNVKKKQVSTLGTENLCQKPDDTGTWAISIAKIFPKGNAPHRCRVLIDGGLLIRSHRTFLDFTSNNGYFLRGVLWQKDNSL
ncbi:hypothetical protein D4R75_15345 [bacterium]|nr:MAG: hypothetical protein D4R75_15345 [bacterium]